MGYIEDLKSEITLDPTSQGYAGMTAAQVAARLNSLTTGRTLPVTLIESWKVREAIVKTEYVAAVAADRQWIDMILAGEFVSNGPGNVRTGFLAVFAAGSTTRTNMAALQTRTVSRATELGFPEVKEGHVLKARAS